VAGYRDETLIRTRAAALARSRPEMSGPSRVDASELRAKAARYRRLAEGLYDPRVIAEVLACARELDAEAVWMDRQAAFGARMVIQRYRITG